MAPRTHELNVLPKKLRDNFSFLVEKQTKSFYVHLLALTQMTSKKIKINKLVALF
jgi:hypothetical protein